MPYIPYTDIDPATGRFPESSPSGGLLNGVTEPVCAAYDALSRWSQAALAQAGANTGPARWLSTRPVFEFLCEPYGGIQTEAPPFPSPPEMTEPCHTFGSVTWRYSIDPNAEDPGWQYGELNWGCTSNYLNPTGGWEWYSDPSGNGQWRLPFNSSGGGTIYLACGGYLGEQRRNAIQVLSLSINYCPECNLPPPIIPPPITPPPQIPPDVNNPPIINIEVNFPRGWGLPDITTNVAYSPTFNIDTDVNVAPVLTLAPRVDISPTFGFAPTFEFSLGGISIGGGGYPESRQETSENTDCNCPDPCPPPEEVDYPRIQRIVEAVATTFRELPGRDEVLFEAVDVQTGAAVELTLTPGCRWINFLFNLSNYTGGETIGIGANPSVLYPGWLFFGRGGSRDYAGERVFLNVESGFIPIPPFAKKCYIQCSDGAIVTARALAIPDLESEVL